LSNLADVAIAVGDRETAETAVRAGAHSTVAVAAIICAHVVPVFDRVLIARWRGVLLPTPRWRADRFPCAPSIAPDDR
jgi:hypothetical protein